MTGTNNRPRAARRLANGVCTLLSLSALCACGGGGGGGTDVSGGSGSTSAGGASTSWSPGIFLPAQHFQAQCAAPRSGVDPVTGVAYPDVQGSTLTQNNWLRSWTNELYLWYDQVQDQNPALYSTTAAYFAQLKTTGIDSEGEPTDKFHFTYATSVWESLSQSDAEPGYGVQWVLVSASPPRQLLVAYAVPNTPASTAPANLARGAQILTIDGVDLVNAGDQAGIDTLNAGITPASVGESHTFTVQDLGSTATRTITLQAVNVKQNPVPTVTTFNTTHGTVGYILFNDQEATAESGLIGAMSQLKAANITDLIIDMRYNGGGYLDIANELAYMVAGPGPTAGRSFYTQQFNNKNPSTNPVTGVALTPESFHAQSVGLSVTAGQALPYLSLSRVFVLTGPSTCSASEAVMNGLQGVNVQVIQIGTTTCGKPYGFYPQDNCGTTYFSIEFRGINDQGFGNYPDGFTPSSSATAGNSATLPGCQVADDFTHALGDPTEARTAAALGYLPNQTCPASSSPPGAVKVLSRPLWATDGIAVKRAARQILILRR